MNLDKISLTYYAFFKEDELHIVNRKVFNKDLLMFNGKEIEIIVRKKRKRRSLNQNAFYWGVVVTIVKEALKESGIIMGIEQVHELLKLKCNPLETVNQKTGEVLISPGSTAILTTSEFMDYLSNIKNWSREFLNIELPEPGEVMQMEFNQ